MKIVLSHENFEFENLFWGLPKDAGSRYHIACTGTEHFSTLLVCLQPIHRCLDNKLNEYITSILSDASFLLGLSFCFEDNFRYLIQNHVRYLALMLLIFLICYLHSLI